ncbi:MAG: type I restriction enzyme HsdR N-terminal domain-containing protein [Deltaproteobacteria bacterium]|nr:type I restriction enzyme HsdR N-terminal domain-containing protein [Deltaproteobacteria bacterium]
MVTEETRHNIRDKVERFLREDKGYAPEDLELGQVVEVVVGEKRVSPVLDIVIRLQDKRLIAIKCAPGSVVSREMEVLSMARLLDSYQIPFSVATNGEAGELLDTVTGRVIGEGLEAIPSKVQALERLEAVDFKPLPEKKAEQAKRVLLASDVGKCPVVCDY